jgi:ribonuclease BN (tRNA processing enzyme)
MGLPHVEHKTVIQGRGCVSTVGQRLSRPEVQVTDVELVFLGSGDAFGSGGRLQACLYLRGGTDDLVVDCGTTSLVAMRRANVDPGNIGYIVVSHLHGDHFGGIPFLVLDGQFSRRKRPLVVAGPPGIQDRVEQAMEVLFPGSVRAARRFAVEFIELAERTPTTLGTTQITAYPVEHACGAPPYALRLGYAGKHIAYSGDTEWTDALIDAADGVDVFVCEAYFFDKEVKYHLDYQTLRHKRHLIRSPRIVLTHMSNDMLHRQDHVDLVCADDGLVITI